MIKQNNFDTIFNLNFVRNRIKEGQRFTRTFRLNAELSILIQASCRTTYRLVFIDGVVPNQKSKLKTFVVVVSKLIKYA